MLDKVSSSENPALGTFRGMQIVWNRINTEAALDLRMNLTGLDPEVAEHVKVILSGLLSTDQSSVNLDQILLRLGTARG